MDHPKATGKMPDMINIEKFPCQGLAHRALMMITAADNTMAALNFIENIPDAGFFFFFAVLGFDVIILGTIRIHNIKRISTRISLMPVTSFFLNMLCSIIFYWFFI